MRHQCIFRSHTGVSVRLVALYDADVLELGLYKINSLYNKVFSVFILLWFKIFQFVIKFFIYGSTKEDQFAVAVQPPPGELLLPVTMSETDFKKEQGEK